MLLSSHSNQLHMVRVFTKVKNHKTSLWFVHARTKVCVTKWISHIISFHICHTHLFTIKAESYDWFIWIWYKNLIWDFCYLCCSPVLPVWTKLGCVCDYFQTLGFGFFLVYLKVFWTTQFLSKCLIIIKVLCLCYFDFVPNI